MCYNLVQMFSTEANMSNFFITYGHNTPRANMYSVVDAPDYDRARDLVFLVLGNKWAFMYGEDEFLGQSEKYSLRETAFIPWENN